MTFFDKLIPSEGLVCVAQAMPTKGFRHFFFEDRKQALAQIEYLDKQGHTVYLAQATFHSDESRKQTNAAWLQNFFLDIDCGEEKFAKTPDTVYPTQKAAVADLKRMLEETGLPFPAVVNSGNGLYAHWFIEEMLPAEQWQTIARMLKQTLAAYGFKADPMRTADSASVLRPPGTTNRKGEGKRVALLRDAEPVKFLEFSALLRAAAKRKQVDTTKLNAPKPNSDINAEFCANLDGPRPSADRLFKKCNQAAKFALSEGDVAEPTWYAMIGLLSFCEETEALADDLIQRLSSGHPDYTEAATRAKIDQFRSTGVGPTTCAQFGTVAPTNCLGCRHNGKIRSPIVLGRPDPKELETATEEVPPPKGFKRAEDGLYFEEEGNWHRFYDCDLAPVALAYDASLGYEVATVRHKLPHEGAMEFMFRSSHTNDPKTLLTCLADNHIKVCGAKEKKAMVAYMEGYLQQLQRNRRMNQLLCQMGWRADRERLLFVLGKRVFYPDGSVDDAALARNVPGAAEGYRTGGEISKWIEATTILNSPGMEPFAFALLCGFAAPLMRFSGFAGAMVSMTGDSGAGKTLMLRFAQSIYGFHDTLMMYKEDTRNALVSRLGVYGSLPLTVDEITNIDGQELSDLVYRVTQGRDKVRLTKNSEEKKNLNAWNTVALVSTNSSVIDKLSSLKHDATAEINRVFEYPVVEHPKFRGEITNALYWCLHENYGHAGERYVQWLVQNTDKLKPAMDLVRKKIDGDAKVRGEERYWSAVAAAAIYGGLVAKSLGLIQFDVARVLSWAAGTIRDMRGQKTELASDSVSILGQFLDEHAANRLLVKGDCGLNKVCIPIDTPRGALIIRHEVDNHKLFVARGTLKSWLGKRFGSYTKIANELKALGALKDANMRKTLGAGTQYGGAQQPCWVIDLKCHKLGAVGLTLVQEAEMLEKGVVG